MAITLYTGLPGHGKTLRVLEWLVALAAKENRPVFHNHIDGLCVDGWIAHDADKWYDLPPNSYMVIDEARKVFPVRPRGAAQPKHVEELGEHRHLGLDLVIITQHPMQIDTEVRKLVDRHFHVVRKFGTKFATIYEFPSGVQDSPEKNKLKNGVVRHEWRYPKNVFAWYKSAEVHTVKARIPVKVWALFVVLLLIPVLMWLAYERVWVQKGGVAATGQAASAAGQAASVPGRVAPGRAPGQGNTRLADQMSEREYLARFRPRIPGLAFSAPVYDELTRPVEAPYPSVCAYSPDFPCRCWSQRGFSLIVGKQLCEQLAREPMDPYWLRRGPHGLERPGEGGSGAVESGGGAEGLPAGAERPLVASAQTPQ